MKIHHHQQLKKPKTKHQDITRHQDFEPAICSMSPAKASGRGSQQAPLVNWFQLSSGILKVLDHFSHNSYICTLASAWQLHVYHPPTPRLFFWSLQHSVLRLLVGIYIIYLYTLFALLFCAFCVLLPLLLCVSDCNSLQLFCTHSLCRKLEHSTLWLTGCALTKTREPRRKQRHIDTLMGFADLGNCSGS